MQAESSAMHFTFELLLHAISAIVVRQLHSKMESVQTRGAQPAAVDKNLRRRADVI